MSTPIERLRALMVVSEARDKPAFLDFFADDVEYHYHVGTRPLVGKDWVDRFITKYWANHSATKWTLVNWAENGDKVLTEGQEDYVNATASASPTRTWASSNSGTARSSPGATISR